MQSNGIVREKKETSKGRKSNRYEQGRGVLVVRAKTRRGFFV
jgi:hypothetical protein